ncbi:MAG: mannosyltransferase family protein [Solirubrobacteraceae bacterium]
MSVYGATDEQLQLVAPGVWQRLAVRLRATTMPVRAFVASRILVFAAGMAGVLFATKRDPAAAAVHLHTLGPVGNLLAGSVDRFDADWYVWVANHGFSGSNGSLAFFPLYPLLMRVGSFVTRSEVIAGAVISAACFMAALVMLHRLTELELGRKPADATVLLLAFAPLSFFFTAVYTESLFLMLSVATVLAARRGHWRLACALGALATLARPTGLMLVVALGVMRIRERRGVDRGLAWVLALPAALIAYLSVLAASGYSFMGPFQAQSHWHRSMIGPFLGVVDAIGWAAIRLGRIAHGTPFYHPSYEGPFTLAGQSLVLLAVLVIACLALYGCRRLPLEYGAYAAAVLLLVLSSPWSGQPLESFDRFTLTIFPLWMAGGAWLARRRLVVPVLAVSSVLLVFYTVQFSSFAFLG